MKTPCWMCSKLIGCPLLANPKGGTDRTKVISNEDTRTCPGWSKTGLRELAMRSVFLESFGMNAIQALHGLPRKPLAEGPMEDPEQYPDLTKMVAGGITHRQREEQLKYETDDKGEFKLDGAGAKIPRSWFVIGYHAQRPDWVVKATPEDLINLNTKELIARILEAEKQAGIIMPAKMAGKTEPAKPVTPEPVTEEKKKMPRSISLRRPTGPVAAAAAGEKVEKPVTSKPPVEETAAAPASGEGVTPFAFKEMLTAKLSEMMSEMKDGLVPAHQKYIDKKFTEMNNQLEAATTHLKTLITDGFTILHDVLIQELTKNQDASLLAKDRDIYSYLEGDDSGN